MHLRKECGGNVHEKGIVEITASSTNHGSCSSVAEGLRSGDWSSRKEPNSWICFDFKENCVSLTHYYLATDSDGSLMTPRNSPPIRWKLEGSNDHGITWKSIDDRDTDDIAIPGSFKTFDCRNTNRREFFRWIRITQTGLNVLGDYCFNLGKVEFFGWMQKC
jgi:hypothetical protein